MTVKELIDKLNEFDDDLNVRISVCGTCQDTSFSVGSQEIDSVYLTANCDDVDERQVELYSYIGDI